MAENTFDIIVDAGQDYVLNAQYLDTKGVPIDISSAVFEANIIDDFVDQQALGSFNVSVTTGVSGQFQMVLPSSVTSTLTPNAVLVNPSQRVALCGLYDCKMTLNAQTVYLLQGKISINRMASA